MRFNVFKNRTTGKSKEKEGKNGAGSEASTVEQIAEMGEKINGRTKNLETKAKQLKGLSGKKNDPDASKDAPVKPHGPLGELSVDPETLSDTFVDEPEAAIQPEEKGEAVKLVQVASDKVAKKEEPKEVKKQDASESLSNLFSQDDDEVNPLANLINSLPDVTAQELMDDLNEIKGIIKEWQQN
jgi:hypothetical protein